MATHARGPRTLRLESCAARGEAYVELDAQERELLAAAVRDEVVPDAEPLKPPRVWRRGPWVFKFYARERRSPLRAHPALRSARAQAAIQPVDSPEPIAALAFSGGRRFDGLLVTRFVAGCGLEELWEDPHAPPAGRAELARFLARLGARDVWHGDLHPGNLRWDGSSWWLLDLDALRRGPWRRLDARREREGWARLFFNLRLDPAFAAVHRAALRELGREARHEREWSRIEARARSIAAARGPDPWHGRGPA